MDFSRVNVLMNEIDVINAVLYNNTEFDFSILFNNTDMDEEHKINKLCELAYKIVKQEEFENEGLLIKMFNDNFPESEVGEFCVEFIKLNILESRDQLDKRIDDLLVLGTLEMPNAQIKIDYLNILLTLLLQQTPMNMELINQYNNQLKEIINK